MVKLYFSIIPLYALLYELLELLNPGEFNGMHYENYSGALRVFKIYIDFLYYSHVCIGSAGFGDIYPNSWYIRILVFSETLLSVAFCNILFSNWIS